MRRLCGLLISVGRTGSRRSGYTTAASLSGLTPTRVVSYGYDAAWQDKLTSYDNGTTAYALTYDASGNPLSYRSGYAFTWSRGRQLAAVSKSGLAVSYEYDAGGNRVSKTVNGSTRTMVVHGGVLLGETLPGGARLEYLRDGTPQKTNGRSGR